MNKKQQPLLTDFLDDEERALIEGIEGAASAEGYQPKSTKTPERVKMFQAAAHNALNEKTTPVTLRLSRTDLVKLKAQAMREGVPYQTWIKSILHKSARS